MPNCELQVYSVDAFLSIRNEEFYYFCFIFEINGGKVERLVISEVWLFGLKVSGRK